MKRTHLLSMALACMLSVSQTSLGQKVTREEWRKQIHAQEATINSYVEKKLNSSPQDGLVKKFYAGIEHEHEIKPADLPKMLDLYLRDHYREKYFEENPGVKSIYNPGRVELKSGATHNAAAAANIRSVACFNGDFESDPTLADYTGFRGATYTGNECNFVPSGMVAYTPISLFTNPNEFQLTNNVPDPLIPALNQTNNGSAHAMRINGSGPCTPNRGINMLQRSFVTPTAGLYQISFSYALVMENPKWHGNAQPFFVARVLNGAGVEVGSRICRVSDLTNPIYNITGYMPNPTGCGTTDSLVWRDWTCASISFQGDPTQTYTIEFFAADCAAGAHFGYAYVDDICASECCPKFFMRDCCDMHGGSSSGAAGRASANNSIVEKVLAEYNQRMAAKYNFAANRAAIDPCCNPCAYPNDPYPVFIMDEFNNLISSTDYVISWSHDPGNSSAYAFILPNQQTVVTVKGPGNCVWTDTLKLNCCNDTITITPFCTWDPCKYPNSPFPVRVLDQNGNTLTTGAGYTFFWQYGSGTSTGDAITATLADFPVIVTVKDSTCEYTDTLDINCCTAKTPVNLKCNEDKYGSHISWDPVPGTHYQVIITVNDPDCCGDQGPRPYTVVWNVAGTDTLVPTTFARCFSWKVIAICPDGTKSPESKKVCSCSPVVYCEPKTPDNLKCKEVKKGSQVSWDPVPGAYYKLVITTNDPRCCRTNLPGFSTVWNVYGTDTLVPTTFAGCFSWYVVAVCPDGTESSPSITMCSCSPVVNCEPKKPDNLKCNREHGGSRISWDPVPGAYYKVVFNVNDPDCCRGTALPYSTSWTVLGTDTLVPTTFANCFSWYVVAICPDGSASPPSGKMCSCSPIVVNLCDDPYKLKCVAMQGGAQLSWAVPAGAGGYELELTYNDPSCCITSALPSMALIGQGTNNYFVPNGSWKCFSWRVRAKCNDGGYSNWVNGGCNCSAVSATVAATSRQGNSNNSGVATIAGKEISVEAVPNPASDYIDFNLNGVESLQNQSLEISIHDITGREVARKAVNADAKVKFDVYSLSPGLYIYKLRSNGELFYSGKIMIDRK